MSCVNETFWDNGYLHEYYYDYTGNKCYCEGIQVICPMFEESEEDEE